jgi:Arm domain-containing DNA-binding protein
MKLRFALTDTALRSAKPRAESYKMFDGGSLFVLVKPNGSMLWRYKFKLGGREKLLTLGQYPAVKLADARKAHQDAKIKLQAGVDPSAARQAERPRAIRWGVGARPHCHHGSPEVRGDVDDRGIGDDKHPKSPILV